MASKIVIGLAAVLCIGTAPAYAQAPDRCDTALGLSKVMLQWQAELERAQGRKFLPAPTSRLDTDCIERQTVIPKWWKALGGGTKGNAMSPPNAASVADCRRVVATLAQWQDVLYDASGSPKLSDPAPAITCVRPPAPVPSIPINAPGRPPR
jgi:hypothetical protein